MQNLRSEHYFINNTTLEVSVMCNEFDFRGLVNPNTYKDDYDMDLQDYGGERPYENYTEIIHDAIENEIEKYSKK